MKTLKQAVADKMLKNAIKNVKEWRRRETVDAPDARRYPLNGAGMTTAQYIAEFCRLNYLRP